RGASATSTPTAASRGPTAASAWACRSNGSTRPTRRSSTTSSTRTSSPIGKRDLTLSSVAWRLLGLLALVCANGFFVAAEFSIVTVRKTRVDQLIAEGHGWARAVRRAITSPDRYIAATQLGVTMASLALGWIAEPAVAELIEPLFVRLPHYVAETTVHSIAVAIAFTIVTAVHI